MFKLGRSILFVFLALGGSANARAEVPSSEVKIRVRTYNYAAVPGGILSHAEQGAAGIFHRAGIELAWIDCPVSRGEIEKFPACTQMTNDPRALTLKILPESMAAGYALPITNLGVTIQH